MALDGAVRAVAAVLIAAFFAVWTALSIVYAVDLPHADQWYTPLMPIGHLFAGNFAFSDDLWRQHNEGRKVVPTAVSVALAAALGRYDPRVELIVGGLLVAAIALLVARLAHASRISAVSSTSLALLFVALAGSMKTVYFHFFSTTFERLIPDLAVVGSLFLLLRFGPSLRTATACAGLLLAGQYSYPGGIAGWLVVSGFVLTARQGGLRAVLRPLLLLVLCGALSTLAYFWSYERPPHHSPLGAIVELPPVEWLRFACRFLGNPMPVDRVGLAGGMILLCFVAASVAALWRAGQGPMRSAALAWIALGSQSIAQAVLATIARLPMDPGHATRPDYVLHGVFLYVAPAGLLLLVASPPLARGVTAVLVGLSALSFLTLFMPRFRLELTTNHANQVQARACLRSAPSADDAGCHDNPYLARLDELRSHAARARAVGAW